MSGQPLDAQGLQVGGDMIIDDVEFGGDATLADANVHGSLSMDSVKFLPQQQLVAVNLQVGGDMIMSSAAFGGNVTLIGANVRGRLVMISTKLAAGQQFVAWGLHTSRDLIIIDGEFGGPVNLANASVGGELDIQGSKFATGQLLNANALQVGGFLAMRNVEFGGPVSLVGANVRRHLDMGGSKIAARQQLNAFSLQVGSGVLMRDAQFGGEVILVAARVGRDLDLRGSTFHHLDLSGVTIGGDLRLGGEGSRVMWAPNDDAGPALALRNAKVGNLQDDEHAWPAGLVLEGFTYTHLGGFGGVGAQDMRGREIKWWRRWLARDPVYSTQPYTQLASVLAASGSRDEAASIRFFGRDRERGETLLGCAWLQRLGLVTPPPIPRGCNWEGWLGLSALQSFVGYGIGGYTFRALYWAIGLAALGTIILCFAPGVRGALSFKGSGGRGPRQHTLVWCFGASLSHLLPVVSLTPEFTEFFNDPQRQRLYSWQQVAFALLALCGWALGLFVVAAFSGLTQN